MRASFRDDFVTFQPLRVILGLLISALSKWPFYSNRLSKPGTGSLLGVLTCFPEENRRYGQRRGL
jgi:hypothetical protein